jgi:hypothetical protein
MKILIPHQYFHFLMLWPNKGKSNQDFEIFETFKQERIEDEKGTKNVVADHLSKLTIDSTFDITPIEKYFPYQSLFSIASIPWSANNYNFLALGFLLAYLDTQDKRKFLGDVQNFYWDDSYLFKYCPNQIYQRCILTIKFYHSKAYEDHFS